MSGYSLYISIIITTTIIIKHFLLEIKDYFPPSPATQLAGVSNILSVLYYNIIIVAARTTQLFRFPGNILNFTENISEPLKRFTI